ncbi:MAG: GT4 family glycosyltransferase PelF [Lachnospiraceae bacterium]|nr:GT4 family glycosyltransferase PelF [Lachnospiraceae bacterium]
MRIALVAEGCYPYVVGGVSSWIHSMIRSFPQHEFIVVAIIADRSASGKFVYELPENLKEVHEIYLQDYEWADKRAGKASRLNKKEYNALKSVLVNREVDWDTLFDMFQKKNILIDNLLMGEDFLEAVKSCYRNSFTDMVFSDFLWTMRSMYLPMFYTMKFIPPKADLYHCVATGYAGIVGSMAKRRYRCGLLVSEHGIYTREREEELIKAKWVQGVYKNLWIDQFKKMSTLAYNDADLITSLYDHARELQIELGAQPSKLMITPNGINMERFQNLPGKLPEDEGYVNIGAVLRVTPIKDVKTMIRAFGYAKQRRPALKLWIMGPTEEDEEYAKECFDLVETMKIPDVVFTGRINVTDYLGRMDFTILTSISEGQPLTILEGYAAHLPAVATDVGNCFGLIYGEDGDELGDAGVVTHIMNVAEIADAMIRLGSSSSLRKSMGEVGYQRALNKYRIQDMEKTYRKIYNDFESNL